MNRKIAMTLLAATAFLASQAQDATIKNLQTEASKTVKSNDSSGWKKGGSFVLNFNQGSLSNWAGGGEQNTVGINAIVNYAINYRNGKNTWDSYCDLALGFQNATSFRRFRKTDDRIDITTKYGRQLSAKWFAAALVNFNTQALIGYDYSTDTKISNFLTPGKLLASVGADFRPAENLSVFISPFTSRWITKRDAAFYAVDAFGVPALRKSHNELGAYLTAKYTKAVASWATYTGRLDLFSNYKRNPQNVDLFFTNLLVMKFNKWLGSTISVDLVYDDDVIGKLQVKEILGIGLTLRL